MLLDRINEVYLDGKLFFKVILAKKFKKRVPFFVNIMVTNRCNMKCIYCVTQCNKLDEPDIPINKLFNIIDELYTLGTRYISIQGGEPLLRDDIGAIIEYINRKGIITELITNGLLIKKRIDALKKVRRLCISIDGFGEYNDLNRGKGSFARIMENIDFAKNNGLNIYRIESTFTKNNINIENLKFLAKLASRLNCIFTPFTALITDYNSCPEYKAVALESQDELSCFWKNIKSLKKDGYTIHFNDVIIDNVVNMPSTVHEKYDELTARKLGLPSCTFGRISCYIDTNGQMYPCVPLFGLSGANIYKQGIKRCWESFNNLPCAYCFIGGFCSFGNINIKSITHLFKVYSKYFAKSPSHKARKGKT